MTADDRARKNLPVLRENLSALLHLAPKGMRVNIGTRDHLRFMLVSFAIKQTEHARSVLKLGTSPDTMLIARSMLEGLSQLLWAMKQPTRRPLLWRAFAFVLDWRLLQRHRAEGRTIDSDVERHTHAGLRRHGRWFLTKEARQARANGRLLPLDPYVKNWYGEREVEIFRDVGGQVLLEHAYGPFSEWHHWRIGAIGRLVSFDAGAREFTMTTFRPSSVALAVACAFQCLWQTMWLMNARCHLRIGRQLRHLHHQQVSIPRP